MEIDTNILGKSIDDVIKAPPTEWDDTSITITTHKDERYDSKNKFVLEIPYFLSPDINDLRTYTICFEPFDIPTNLKQLFFSFKNTPSFEVGGLIFKIYQLKDSFNEYMHDKTLNSWTDKVVKEDYVGVYSGFEPKFAKQEKIITIYEETKQIMLVIEPDWSSTGGRTFAIETQNIRNKYNDIFSSWEERASLLFYDSNYNISLWQEAFNKKRLSYFMSENEPELPPNLDNYDFSNIWLCTRNILDENNNIVYEKDVFYALETDINYEQNTYTINGWKKLDGITKEMVDNGYDSYFFAGWRCLVEQVYGEGNFQRVCKGVCEFGDIMFSTINYEWSPATGETIAGTSYKTNKNGIFIENNEEGFKREISASKDISTNLQTGNQIWKMTPSGQWVQILEAEQIIMGNYHIVEEEDELKFYYRGGD